MDRTWTIAGKSLDTGRLREAAQALAARYEGVEVTVEREESDFVTCFFTVPSDDGPSEIEISIYDMGKSGLVLSLEADAADNDAAWDDASQLAEDLSEALDGVALDL